MQSYGYRYNKALCIRSIKKTENKGRDFDAILVKSLGFVNDNVDLLVRM